MTHSSRLRRFVGLSSRFLTVGAISTVIEIVTFNFAYYVCDFSGVWSKIVASLIALINAYFGNREWTFKGRGRHGRSTEIVLFLGVNGACTVLGAGIIWAGLHVVSHADPITVNLINLGSIIIVVVIRFMLYHYLVFRGVRANPESTDY